MKRWLPSLGPRVSAAALFYPAASIYGALLLPLSVLVMTGRIASPAALADPRAHAHEMLLGFALGVVAGNQLGSVRPVTVTIAFVAWLAARSSFLVAPASFVTLACNAGFALFLGWQVAPRLVRSAKKLRNQGLPALVGGLCLAAVVWSVATTAGRVRGGTVSATVVLFAGLLLFMGGRIIAPSVAGQLYRQGFDLGPRVQPRLEEALLVAVAIALGGVIVDLAIVTAGALVAAGVLAAVRMARWRVWRVRGRADLVALAIGYAWLAAGLVALGLALDTPLMSAAIHVLTVGALGTLTLNVMAMTWLLRARRPGALQGSVVTATALIALATVFRVAGAFYPIPWLFAASACWTCAYFVLLYVFWRTRRGPTRAVADSAA